MITATIVDDEPYCCEALATLLERYCPDVKILDICYSAADALQSIHDHKPQILFLDIEMPHMNGFELLQKIPSVNFSIIFTLLTVKSCKRQYKSQYNVCCTRFRSK